MGGRVKLKLLQNCEFSNINNTQKLDSFSFFKGIYSILYALSWVRILRQTTGESEKEIRVIL